jgi:CopG family nickel-responsive transcriptional regulator
LKNFKPGDKNKEEKMAKNLVRLSLSIEEPLYLKLEKLVKENGYTNRSEFVRDLVRDRLVSDEWASGEDVIGTITLIYEHGRRELSEKLTDLQHHHHGNVLAATHLHLSETLCAEMIMVRGATQDIKHLFDHMRKQRGVLHSGITMSSTGEKLN